MRVFVNSSHTIRLEALELLVRSIGFNLFSPFETFSGPVLYFVDLIDTAAPYPDARHVPTLALVSEGYCPNSLTRQGYLAWVGAEDSSEDLCAILKTIEQGLARVSKVSQDLTG